MKDESQNFCTLWKVLTLTRTVSFIFCNSTGNTGKESFNFFFFFFSNHWLKVTGTRRPCNCDVPENSPSLSLLLFFLIYLLSFNFATCPISSNNCTFGTSRPSIFLVRKTHLLRRTLLKELL